MRRDYPALVERCYVQYHRLLSLFLLLLSLLLLSLVWLWLWELLR